MGSTQSRKALDRARALHQKGSLADAERLYLAELRRDAGSVDALHLLGLLNAQRGDLEAARALLDRGLGLDPGRAELHFLRAEVAGGLGLPEQALDGYRQALAVRPDYADALINLGGLLLQLDRAQEALPLLDRALQIRPQDMAALNNRGNALQALKRHDEALRSFDRVLEQLPGNADVLNNRASALLAIGRFAEAAASCTMALAQRADHFHARVNLARAHSAQGLLAEALADIDAALALKSDDADAWCDKGMVLTAMRRLGDALSSFDRSLALTADSWRAWNERGVACALMGQLRDALRCYDRALSLRPEHAMLSSNRAEALRALGRTREARDAFARLLAVDPGYPYALGKRTALSMVLCDWRAVAGETSHIVDRILAGARAAEPLDLLILTERAGDQLLCAQTYARDKYAALPGIARGVNKCPRNKIRIAYLSADFRAHPTSYLLAGVLERHDRSRFETFGLACGPEERSEMAARMTAAFDHFIDIRGLSDKAVVELLRDNEIGIVVDLMGYTRFGRPEILASRPCPIQVNYLGFPATMGADFIDYIVADAFVIPPGSEGDYAESVVRLPHTYQANDAERRAAEQIPPRSQLSLPADGAVFCSFNNSAKLSPAMFPVWMQILAAVKDSVLWLWGGGTETEDNLRREAEVAGISGSRLVFAPWTPYPQHLARLQQADLALDTLPFNGGATSSDALWSGVPVITCPGSAFSARMTGSLLHAVGMPELIAPSLEDYRALAIGLATDRDFLARTKAKLAVNRKTHPLFDTDRFRRHIEAAYEIMWRRYQAGEPPAAFAVDAIADAPAAHA